MNSTEIRQKFLDFFASKQHTIVPSAPIVVKNDPTLMFTNAGMNQFKDIFLGNEKPKNVRVADTQKCLRVSGKHNDLEEVGIDTYHHTMFEMLGNWSFGDYFKKEAIEWAWELLTKKYGLDKDRLYVTIFEGDEKENLAKDEDAKNEWKKWIAEDRILLGNKKDNFWEMGDTGPCGPCSEIHVDLRNEEERKNIDARTLVNNDHPQVIEIWNLVFMEFNRKADGSLENLPSKHVDTGMGFERLVRAIEGKSSNYDTDVFMNYIHELEKISGIKFGANEKTDIAMRVISDHLRTVCFSIVDGQMPSNTGAGYVIRRILRRAIRYGYSFLNQKEAFIYKLIPIFAKNFESIFPEISQKKDFITNVLREEEEGFLRTLEKGLEKIHDFGYNHYINFELKKLNDNDDNFEKIQTSLCDIFIYNKKTKEGIIYLRNSSGLDNKNIYTQFIQKDIPDAKIESIKYYNPGNYYKLGNEYISEKSFYNIPSKFVFELYDTFGFPIDLTQLIVAEKGWTVDVEGFQKLLQEQKDRSRKATSIQTDDWVTINEFPSVEFTGYDLLEDEIKIARIRKIKNKGKEHFQLVFNKTPFYAESGGQVGDTGFIQNANEKIAIENTLKENNLIVHIVNQLPQNPEADFTAVVNKTKRISTENNHSATHLLHAALRHVLGTHVEQKGSLVNEDYLRFDFSHFKAMSAEEMLKVEQMVNEKIRENIVLNEQRNVPISEAKNMGAMALFGEKYGDSVRVIIFDKNYSVELCGGTHVKATGQIGYFKLLSENAVAAGIRRIEAISGIKAETFITEQNEKINELKNIFKTNDIVKSAEQLIEEKAMLLKKLEKFEAEKAKHIKAELLQKIQTINGIKVLAEIVEVPNAEQLKNIAFQLKNEVKDLVSILGTIFNDKPLLSVMIDEDLVKTKNLHAGNMIKTMAKEIKGGGGGQPFYATAGGNDSNGLQKAIEEGKKLIG